jgi:hypothetical protein
MIESPPPLNILIQPSLPCLRRWEEAHGSGRLMRGSERVEVCPLQALQLDGSRSRRRYRSSSHCYLSHSSTQQWLGTSLSHHVIFSSFISWCIKLLFGWHVAARAGDGKSPYLWTIFSGLWNLRFSWKFPSPFLSKVFIFVPLILQNGIFLLLQKKCGLKHRQDDEIYRRGTLSIFVVISLDGIL